MRRFTIILAILAVAAIGPAAALGKPHGTDRPVKGTSTSTTTVDLATGTGISDGSGRISHLGRFTFHNDFTGFTVTGDTFSWTQTATIVAPSCCRIRAAHEPTLPKPWTTKLVSAGLRPRCGAASRNM